MSTLWNLVFDTNNSLPLLVRGTETGQFNYNTDGKIYGKLNKGKPYDPINVVQDFPWTKSPKSSRDDVPRVQLIEKRLLTNSTMTNFFYSIMAAADITESVTQRVGAGLPVQVGNSQFNIFQSASGLPGAGSLSSLLKSGASGLSNLTKNSSITNQVKDFTNGVKNDFQSAAGVGSFDQSVLSPYEGLYITENTGFQYILPYLDDQFHDVTTSYGGGDSFLANMSNTVADAVDVGAAIAAVDKPGVYIEGSRQFNMKDDGRTINIKFPLLNTGEFSDITRNWQLIYGLVYQNKPGRVNRSLIDVPVIYELFIEGLAYMPYAYIKKMSVNFLGSRRRMKIDVPTFNIPQSRESRNEIPSKTAVTLTVPDAYMVDIQLEGMNDETRNFLFRSLGNTIITSKETNIEIAANTGIDGSISDTPPLPVSNARTNKIPRSIKRI